MEGRLMQCLILRWSVIASICALGACNGSDDPGPFDAHSEVADARSSLPDSCLGHPACTPDPPPDLCDLDGDGARSPVCGGNDCDDHDEGAYPGAAEYPCDHVDQDCDGQDYCQPDNDMTVVPAPARRTLDGLRLRRHRPPHQPGDGGYPVRWDRPELFRLRIVLPSR